MAKSTQGTGVHSQAVNDLLKRHLKLVLESMKENPEKELSLNQFKEAFAKAANLNGWRSLKGLLDQLGFDLKESSAVTPYSVIICEDNIVKDAWLLGSEEEQQECFESEMSLRGTEACDVDFERRYFESEDGQTVCLVNPTVGYDSDKEAVKEQKPVFRIFVDKATLKQLDGWLDSTEAVEDAGRDEILYSETVVVGDKTEVDIKLVNSEDGPYIDAVMFKDGCDIGCLEPTYSSYDGRYEFDECIVIVEAAKEGGEQAIPKFAYLKVDNPFGEAFHAEVYSMETILRDIWDVRRLIGIAINNPEEASDFVDKEVTDGLEHLLRGESDRDVTKAVKRATLAAKIKGYLVATFNDDCPFLAYLLKEGKRLNLVHPDAELPGTRKL